ncbi:MAG: hypothetical protein MJ236_04480 [Clostridia bacterium]|nr:hypothetical protein [Clostridia bacterium]
MKNLEKVLKDEELEKAVGGYKIEGTEDVEKKTATVTVTLEDGEVPLMVALSIADTYGIDVNQFTALINEHKATILANNFTSVTVQLSNVNKDAMTATVDKVTFN